MLKNLTTLIIAFSLLALLLPQFCCCNSSQLSSRTDTITHACCANCKNALSLGSQIGSEHKCDCTVNLVLPEAASQNFQNITSLPVVIANYLVAKGPSLVYQFDQGTLFVTRAPPYQLAIRSSLTYLFNQVFRL